MVWFIIQQAWVFLKRGNFSVKVIEIKACVAARFGSDKQSSSFVRYISDEKPPKGFTFVQLFWPKKNTLAYLSLVSKMFELDAFAR
jgi:hypothetical protein